MDCTYVTNPFSSGTNASLLNTGNVCSETGNDWSVFNGASSNIFYLFGANIYKQALPVAYSGSSIIPLPSQYDPSKYIAEIFPIRDTTPENVNFVSTGNFALASGYLTPVYTASIINTFVPVTLNVP